ncbi:copper amine oxidase [Nocardioides limicola]|uniref:copper amine oxidase n=1 Tax=Nocardioides limicola TaxID=2803368 RepID=UPI0023B32A7F|nr:hypothetical protein [Nocardioides sp. DJM-14]
MALIGCTFTAPAHEGPGSEAVPVGDLECSGAGIPLSHELSNGAAWSLCFGVDNKRGMVLTDIHYAPVAGEWISIAAEISLAQLEVPYDHGERLTADITSAGFGGLRMHTLTDLECLGDRIAAPVPNIGDGSSFGETPVREVLCTEVADSGLAFRSRENNTLLAARGSEWRLSTISKVGWYEYVSQYTFGSDGSIAAALGATGDLSPVDYAEDPTHGWSVGPGDSDHAASHSHNAVWRIHWALGEGPLSVEQYDATPIGRTGSRSPILEGRLTPIERPTSARWADRRWWRVLAPGSLNHDGRPISYQLDLGRSDGFTFVADQDRHGPDAGYDVAFTNADGCQVFATANRGGCGSGVVDFVNRSATESLHDVVSWVAIGYHHVPRDEDQSPMQLHWQGFTATPRDLTAQRVDVPPGREEINGQPEHWEGEPVEELLGN